MKGLVSSLYIAQHMFSHFIGPYGFAPIPRIINFLTITLNLFKLVIGLVHEVMSITKALS